MTRLRLTEGVTLLFILILSTIATASDYSNIYVFGDSIVDNGNSFTYLKKYPETHADDYYQGRASNGPVLSERLATKLGLTLTPHLLLPENYQGGINYAYAGAQTNQTNKLLEPYENKGLGFPQQIDQFLSDFPDGIDQDALYLINIGANDLGDTWNLIKVLISRHTRKIVFNKWIRVIEKSIQRLKEAGARNVVVISLLNVGEFGPLLDKIVPKFKYFRITGTAENLTRYTLAFNEKLESALIDKFGSDLQLMFFDAHSAFNVLLENSEIIDTVCRTEPGIVCNDPEKYLFFDLQHLTTQHHETLAEMIYQQIH